MRGMARTLSRQAGVSLLELIAGVVLFAVVVAVALQSSLASSRVTASLVSTSDLDLQAHRVLEQVTRELGQARLDSMTPEATAPYGASGLTYERAEIDGTGAIAWSAPRRIEFVQAAGDPLDGTDNDGNGLVDDGEIWLVTNVGEPGQQRSLLLRHVARFVDGEVENLLDDNGNGLIDERGLSFERREGLVFVRISVQCIDPDGHVATRTAESAVRTRN